MIRAEKKTGTRRDGRSELDTLLQFLRGGDTLVVTRIDRLARSLKDLQDIVHELKEKGVTLKATEQPVDTSTAAGKAFFDMLGVFAEFETNLRRERQMEGIAAAKTRGVYKGRKPKIAPEEVRRLHAEEKLSPSAIARRLGIARSSVYRFLPRIEEAESQNVQTLLCEEPEADQLDKRRRNYTAPNCVNTAIPIVHQIIVDRQ